MSVWKSFVERMKDARNDLARQAAKKVARTALDSAGKAVGEAGRALQSALLGDDPRAPPTSEEAPKPDPFAKLKAAETERHARERTEKQRAKERAAEQKKLDEDLDVDLAAIKKKLGK